MAIAWITTKIEQQLIKIFYSAHGEIKVFTPVEFVSTSLHRPSTLNVIVIEIMDRQLLDTCKVICHERIAPVLAIVPNLAYAQAALEAGADDFLVGPVDPIEALLRLGKLARAAKVVRVGKLEIDLDAWRVSYDGHSIRLSSFEFRLLACLAKRVGQTVSYAELMREVWEQDADGGTLGQVKNCINRVRMKIEPDLHVPQYIITFQREGYQLRNQRQWKEWQENVLVPVTSSLMFYTDIEV